ncbi:hypothetical protein GFY24_13650 [Nocardia sp. SYP-A9097]|uniref:hypothetical protein n=1 Tax=Nocardia sp. SYP-A9097 TaxID=2663237 RepID=UPI00129B85C8|nr:hypothetical protein [Nocardia sp. SYP-A9097]MRH88477.1 hypothetical protein [Nocardia sp. SYP-A9097]
MVRQQQHSRHNSIGRQRSPIRSHRLTHPARTQHPARESAAAPNWLLLELPTAILLAIFVGTGWLGYAQPSGTPSQPRPAVVVPADHPVQGR